MSIKTLFASCQGDKELFIERIKMMESQEWNSILQEARLLSAWFTEMANAAPGLPLSFTFFANADVVVIELTPTSLENINALRLSGTAAELDEGFFDKIGPAMAKTVEASNNLAVYEKSLSSLKPKPAATPRATTAKPATTKTKAASETDEDDEEENEQADEVTAEKETRNEKVKEEPTRLEL